MDVPDDIQKTAFKEAIAWLQHEREFGKHAQSLTDAVGRAIWAERERCEKIAESFWNHGGPSFRLVPKLIAAIRTDTAQEQPNASESQPERN